MLFQGSRVVMYMNDAHEAPYEEYETLYTIVKNMAVLAKVPTPKVYVIQDDGLNAFATGSSPKNSAVAVTTGLMKKLNRYELQAVIAHEMGHIRNYDVRLQTITIALASIMTFLVDMMFRSRRSSDSNAGFALVGAILALIVAVVIAPLVNLAISRAREYQADATAARLTRNPMALISALNKISENPKLDNVPRQSAGMYIASPLSSEWFSTHPKMEKRIKRLEELLK
jgi:heat shock protein HtpX